MTDLGTRYECSECATKFYDLGSPDRVCPKCGTHPLGKEVEPEPEAETPAEQADADDEDDEDDDLDEELEDLDDDPDDD